MNYRERFEATLNHQPVDRVPFDLAGTSLTAMDAVAMNNLRDFLGFPQKYDHWYDKFDERILRYLDVDFRRVGGILEPESLFAGKPCPHEEIDCWGVKRVFTGAYWEIADPPLKGAVIDDLNGYPWPKAENIDLETILAYRENARRLFEETEYVVCAEHPVYGIMELGCWMCGFDDFLLKMALEPEFVTRFFDIVLSYQKKAIEIYYGALGDCIHFTTSGDDFGTQTGPFISPGMFKELVAPYLAERIDYTRKFTKAYYFHHTCGSVFPLIPHLIDAGVDILNPIQPGARDMEPAKLKRAFGERLTFHGGIDTQHLLPESSVKEIGRAVFSTLDALADGGGYILSPAHNVQTDVPPENLIAVYQAAEKYYGLQRGHSEIKG